MNLTADYTICNFDNQSYTNFYRNDSPYWYYPFYEYSVNNPSSSSFVYSTGVYCLPFHVNTDSNYTQMNINDYEIMNELQYNLHDSSESSIRSIDDTSLLMHSFHSNINNNSSNNNESLYTQNGIDYKVLFPTMTTSNNIINHIIPTSLSLSPALTSSSLSSLSSTETGDVIVSTTPGTSPITAITTINNSISSSSVSGCWSDNSAIRRLTYSSNDHNSVLNNKFSLSNNSTENTTNSNNITIHHHDPHNIQYGRSNELNIQPNTNDCSINLSFQFKTDSEQHNELMNPIDNSFQKLSDCLLEYQQYNDFTKPENFITSHRSPTSSSSSLYSELLLLKQPITSSSVPNLHVKPSYSNEFNKSFKQPDYLPSQKTTDPPIVTDNVINMKYNLSSTMKLSNLILPFTDRNEDNVAEINSVDNYEINKNPMKNDLTKYNHNNEMNNVKFGISTTRKDSVSCITSTNYVTSQMKCFH
ncbi:hypothetical protein EWB00_000934 [Schistosoma japonicum]|uniref:Uncharacterized protein n=2 Tax=Schistosoma japonicum TaxID=6182 RepID=A0A4Z2DHM6_SCHJA|nr:hypothetical protein EWB00_000934 [Schistosoma japonicum]